MEIWKTITDYPNYQVSNYGNAIEKQTKSRREIVVAIKDNIIVKIKNNIVVETIK